MTKGQCKDGYRKKAVALVVPWGLLGGDEDKAISAVARALRDAAALDLSSDSVALARRCAEAGIPVRLPSPHAPTPREGQMISANLLMVPPELDGPAGDHLAAVLTDVARERVHQDARWGGPSHDDTRAAPDWHDLIYSLLDEAEEAHRADDFVEYRRVMVEIAASAVAAVQSHDRLHPAESDGEGIRCDILTRTLIHDVSDPDYPAEWLCNASGEAWCTAFAAKTKVDPS